MAIIDQLNIKKLYDVKEDGSGLPAISTVSSTEYIDGAGLVHKAVLTLNAVPLPIVSVTTGNGVGGITLYTMPKGLVKMLGGAGHLSLAVAAAEQDNFTDNTPEGDLGLGVLAPANADALGTDATDDNILTAAAFTCAAFADADIDLVFDGEITYDGTETAMPIVLTGLVDAADVDDDATTEVEVSGTITLIYQNLGDK